ncbi:MAG TPA: ABC transporter permease [Kofleriaceae bacterium]|nr:ABC transporter permease [Kofleriaceae bacterium]
MSVLSLLGIALGALGRNKLRSLLTILGVVIGVAAVIAMVSVGQGARAKVSAVFDSMGTNLVMVMPGSSAGGGVMGGFGSSPTLTWGDLEAIRTELSAVKWAAPVMSTRAQVSSAEKNWNTSINGTTSDYFKIRNWSVASGRAFDEGEDAAGARVAVVGQTVVRELFGTTENVVGQSLRIGGAPFEIVGVLVEKGQSPMGQDQDDVIYIPARAYQSKLEGSLGTYLKGTFNVSAASAEDTDRAVEQITTLLRDRHRLPAGRDDDFSVRNLTEFARAQASSTETITTMLAAIAAVSLLVGGIGIMNIMLVSVVERTREVGLRMAVGATPAVILGQFLVEALILAGIGGVLGLAAGWQAAAMLATSFGFALLFPAETAVQAIAVSGAIGIVFGLWPALKAAQLDPITALRYES